MRSRAHSMATSRSRLLVPAELRTRDTFFRTALASSSFTAPTILRFMSAYLPRIPLLKSIDCRLLAVAFFIVLSFFSGRFLSADYSNLILRFCEAYDHELTSIRFADYVKTDF